MLKLPFPGFINKATKIGNSIRKCCKNHSTATSSLSYCVDLVKKLDYENYLCTLLLPHTLRATAFAIRAFNVEISKIQEQVTEAQILPIRFKFWEDRLNDIYNDKVVQHPVLIEVRNAVRRHKLSKMFFKKLIAVRLKHSGSCTFKDINEMSLYADQTNSPVYMLLLEASGIKNIDCDHTASHLGIAQGVTNLIRGLPCNIKERLLFLPMTVLAKHDVSEECVLRMTAGSKLNDVILDVAQVAYKHLKIAQSLQNKVPYKQRCIFLPAVAVDEYLKVLENINFDVFNTTIYYRKAFLPLVLLYKNISKGF